MAKKKSAKKTTTGRRRRRRVSGVGNVEIQTLLLAGAGAFAAHKLNTMLTKDPTKTTLVNIAPYAGLALGIGLPMLVKNPMVKPLALGIGATGLLQALKKIAPGIVGNIDTIPVITGTLNRYRGQLKPSVNGVGYSLPDSSVYRDSMSVVNGIGSNVPTRSSQMPNGSGAANPGY